MTKDELAKTDNPADCTITLRVSGNQLVKVLNALDAAMYGLGRYKFVGNDCVACEPWYADLRDITEAMRDELSAQRMEQRP